jgi:hypothetical protein
MTFNTTNTEYLSSDQFNKLLREEQSLRPTARRDTYDAFTALRKPRKEEVLQRLAFTWLAKLPTKVRPIELGRAYPRIANRLAAIWIDPALTAKYFGDLLENKRGNRRGFPPSIEKELRALRYFHNQVNDFSDSLWSEERGRSQFKGLVA